MTRKKWCLIGAAVLGLGIAGISASINPIAERYVAPMVQEQLHNTVRGTIQYDSIHVTWDGDIELQNVSLRDESNHLVADVPTMNVSMKWSSVPSIVMGNSSGAAVVSTITLDKPDIHVWQLADGSWNVNSLLKPSPKSDKKSFDGNIVINDATSVIRFKDGNVHRLAKLDGNIALNLDGMTKGVLNGLLDDHSIAINGSVDMNKMDDFDLFVQADAVDVSGIMNLAPTNKNLSVTAGVLHDVKAQITSRDGKYSMSGNLAFDGVDGTYKNGSTTYQISKGNGKIFFQNNNILISRSGWYINNQAVKVNGLVTLSDDVDLNLNAVADSVALETFTNNQFTGIIGGRVHIGGTSVNPNVSGTIKSNEVSYDDYRIDSGEANFIYSDGTVDIRDATLYIGDGSVNGRGKYNVDSGDFSVEGTIHNAEIAPFTQNLATPISGIVNGDFAVTGKNRNITALEGNVIGSGISARGISLDTAKLSFTKSGTITNIAVTGAMGNGLLSGYGTIDNNNLNLSLSADSLDVSNFSTFVGKSIFGNITGYASITGDLDNVSVTGSITSPEIIYDGAHFNSINAGFTIKDHVLALENASIGDGDGAITIGGTLNLDSNALNMRARAKAVRIENLIRPFTDIPLTGWFESENEIRGTVDNPYVHGYAHLYDGSYSGKLISDAKFDYTLDNQMLTLSLWRKHSHGLNEMKTNI